MFLSFIIPTYNEAKYIARSIRSIQANVTGRYDYEIIVVDNASTDNTAEIAKSLGVTVLHKPYKFTISAVRNAGVSASKGDVLIFVDGDVYLHHTWIEQAPPILERVSRERWMVGSVYAVDPEASWIAHAWFQPWFDKQTQVTFINGGHLLVSRKIFDEIGGFDESFETGEDHEICERAKRHGVVVENLPQLISVHLGYPNTLGHFFRRERWHGKGNFSPLRRIFASKIPIITLLFLVSLICSIVSALWTQQAKYLLGYPIFVLLATGASAWKWVGGFRKNFLPCMFLSWVYFTARGFSFFDVLREKLTRSSKTTTKK